MSPQGIILDGKRAPALVALYLVVLHMCTLARTPFVRCACTHTRRVGEERRSWSVCWGEHFA